MESRFATYAHVGSSAEVRTFRARVALFMRVTTLAFLVSAFAVVWLSLLWSPLSASGPALDPGWSIALGHFLKHGMQAGVDYVFTYGPLGYLMVRFYVPGLFWLKYVFAALFALLEAGLLIGVMRRLPSRVLWIPFLWLVLVTLPEAETRFVLVIVMAAIWAALDQTESRVRLGLVAFLFACLGLVKFTLCVLGLVCLSVIVVFARPYGRLRVAAVSFGTFVGAFLLTWISARQSPGNIGRFLSGSFEIASGYSAAMGKQGRIPTLQASVEVLVLLLAAAGLHGAQCFRSRRHVTVLALSVVGLLFAWKEGFTRQVPDNALLYFRYAAFFPALLLATPRLDDRDIAPLKNALFLVSWCVCIALLDDIPKHPLSRFHVMEPFGTKSAVAHLKAHASVLLSPRATEERLRRKWQNEKNVWRLGTIQRRVGQATIDVVSRDLGLVFWNDWNWKPRPIMQGYAAYTPKLAAMNGDFFRREDAPRFVLCRWSSIDGWFPAEDDGRVLLELIRNYTEVAKERGYLLLERRPEGQLAKLPGRVVWRRSVPFGEKIPLPESPHKLLTLTIEAPYSVLGRLRRLAYWVPPLGIRLDVDGASEPKDSPLLPELAASEFLVNPLVADNGTLSRVYEGRGRLVTAFRLSADDHARSSFRGYALVTLREYEAPAARSGS